jgi:hypothetical protein
MKTKSGKKRKVCSECVYGHFREMIEARYCYTGEIPCLSCEQFIQVSDNFRRKP